LHAGHRIPTLPSYARIIYVDSRSDMPHSGQS
jgi:hypothetical protein